MDGVGSGIPVFRAPDGDPPCKAGRNKHPAKFRRDGKDLMAMPPLS
jgi:hypothetical protein